SLAPAARVPNRENRSNPRRRASPESTPLRTRDPSPLAFFAGTAAIALAARSQVLAPNDVPPPEPLPFSASVLPPTPSPHRVQAERSDSRRGLRNWKTHFRKALFRVHGQNSLRVSSIRGNSPLCYPSEIPAILPCQSAHTHPIQAEERPGKFWQSHPAAPPL